MIGKTEIYVYEKAIIYRFYVYNKSFSLMLTF
jgi:hypothetical protein